MKKSKEPKCIIKSTPTVVFSPKQKAKITKLEGFLNLLTNILKMIRG